MRTVGRFRSFVMALAVVPVVGTSADSPTDDVAGTRPAPVNSPAPSGPYAGVVHSGAVRPRHATSANWAGWVTTGGVYRSVQATWRQPRVRCVPGVKTYSSFWVGLDGAGSNTVEQIGTEADCDAYGRAHHKVWYELYPKPPVYLKATIAPGDLVRASVAYRGSATYTLVLRNVSRNWTQTRTATLPGGRNASAEVIAEAPSGRSGVLPLSQFETVGFVSAYVNGTVLGSVPNPRRVTMVSRGVVKASASGLLRGKAFTVTWRRR